MHAPFFIINQTYLEVATLRECETAVVLGTNLSICSVLFRYISIAQGTHVGPQAGVSSAVNVKVSLLNEALVAVRAVTHPLLLQL